MAERAHTGGGLPRLIYIAGDNRGGSTLLDQILGEPAGSISTGELFRLWQSADPAREPPGGPRCGCGAPVRDCAFWRQVRAAVEAKTGLSAGEIYRLQELERRVNPATLVRIAAERRRAADGPLRNLATVLAEMYRQIAAVSGADLVVDSSKSALRAYLLAALTEIELFVVHLVRDPRALAYKWGTRELKDPDLGYFPPLSPASTSVRWLRRHATLELALRQAPAPHLLLRYEDLAARPRESLRSISGLAGVSETELPFVDERTVRLGPNHTVGGNPKRFAAGEIEIREDTAWKAHLPRSKASLVTLITAPLLRRYQYPLRAPSA